MLAIRLPGRHRLFPSAGSKWPRRPERWSRGKGRSTLHTWLEGFFLTRGGVPRSYIKKKVAACTRSAYRGHAPFPTLGAISVERPSNILSAPRSLTPPRIRCGLILRYNPPEPAVFFNERFTDARHEEGCFRKNIFSIFLYPKEALSNDDVGMARRYGRKLVSKPAISLNESWGGYRRTTLRSSLSLMVVVMMMAMLRQWPPRNATPNRSRPPLHPSQRRAFGTRPKQPPLSTALHACMQAISSWSAKTRRLLL